MVEEETYTLFPRYTDLFTIYSLKSLYENLRNQLEYLKFKAKNSCIEMGKKIHLIWTMSASPPSWYWSHWRRKAQTIASSLREKEKSGETYVQNYGFWGDYARDWFLSCLTQSMDETGTVWMPRDHERQKRAQQLLKVQ